MNSISTVMVSIIRYGWHHPRCQVTATRWSLRRHSFQNPLTFTESPWVFFSLELIKLDSSQQLLGCQKCPAVYEILPNSLADCCDASCFRFAIYWQISKRMSFRLSFHRHSLQLLRYLTLPGDAWQCLATLWDSLRFLVIQRLLQANWGESVPRSTQTKEDTMEHTHTFPTVALSLC